MLPPGRAQITNMSESIGAQGPFPRVRTSRFGGRVLRSVGALGLIVGVTASAVVGLGAGPAAAATAPTWATGQYFDAIQNVPFCDDVSISNSAALPLTSMTAGTTPSGFTNYSIQNVDLATGTAQICGTDTNAPVSSGTPPDLGPVATNSGGSATDDIPIGSYGSCSWTSSAGTTQLFDANQDLYQTGTQSAFGAAIANGETLGSTSNYATCTDTMVAEEGSGETSGEGDAWTVNTANPLPTPTDSNPSASQGDLASSNLFLNSGGCYGSLNLFTTYSYSNFGSGTSLTTPTPWVNGGDCKYGSLGDNEAGGNTDSFATCPPTQSDVNAGLVSCTIIASSGNDYNGSINYSSRRPLLHRAAGSPAIDRLAFDLGDHGRSKRVGDRWHQLVGLVPTALPTPGPTATIRTGPAASTRSMHPASTSAPAGRRPCPSWIRPSPFPPTPMPAPGPRVRRSARTPARSRPANPPGASRSPLGCHAGHVQRLHRRDQHHSASGQRAQ